MLKLYLFSSPRVDLDGVQLTVSRRKVLALLIYLAVNNKPHSRDMLSTLFYPEADQQRARAYLRRDLAVLNTGLADEWLVADRETIELKSGFWLDVAHFRQCVQACREQKDISGDSPQISVPDCIPLLTEAVNLYTDDFLAGFTLRDSAEFDDWQFFQAESLRQELAFALMQLVHALSGDQQYDAAIPHARRWLALDPLHEPAQRQLIQLYDLAGQPAMALRQYEEYVELLEEELGLPPEEETTTLYEAIKAKRLLGSFLKSEIPKQQKERPLSTKPQPPAAHNLPLQSTPFIGRTKELTEIQRLLADSDCRLLTLLGPGGIGKTRLALAVANELRGAFRHGVYFVPLAPLNSAENIVSSLADATNFTFYEGREPRYQLLDHLQHKQMLLVLDNFEPLLKGAGLVSEILKSAPGLKILVTSREQLNLSGETLYPLSGLSAPDQRMPESVYNSDAIKLLIQQARLIRPDFEPTMEDDIAAMVRISQLTQGMPLALVLAAGWFEMLSFSEIADEISSSFDILETEQHDVPERQRSVRVTFNYSWQRLSPQEQQIFAKLSIFRGGFSREAARAIAGAELRTLRGLVKKSLLSLSQENRYEVHELLRQYAAERLAASPEIVSTQEAHSVYYLNLLYSHQGDITGPQQARVLNEIETDLENIRTAWHWAVENNHFELIECGLESLYHFYAVRSRFQEGKDIFGTTAKHLQTLNSTSQSSVDPTEKLLGKLLAREGAFCYVLGLIKQAAELLGRSKEIAQSLDNKKEQAFVLNCLGELARVQADYSSAIQFFQESLTFGRMIDDELSIGHSLKGLGWAAGEEGSAYHESKRYYQEALIHYRAAENRAEVAFCLDKLGYTAWQLGDYLEAEPLFLESLTIFEETGDLLGQAKVFGGLALVNMDLDDEKRTEAKSFAQKSLAICRETGHQVETVNRLIILGMSLLRLNQLDQAQSAYQEALEISNRISYRIGIPLAANGLGEVAYLQGDLQKAREYLMEALKIAAIHHRAQDIAEVLANFALVLVQEAEDSGVGEQLKDQDSTSIKLKVIEILSLILNDPGAWKITKDKATHLMIRLESELPPDLVSTVQNQRKNKTLEPVIAEILGSETGQYPVGRG